MRNFFIGIDISKKTIECAYTSPEGIVITRTYQNNEDGFKEMIKDIKVIRSKKSEMWFVMENTGDYTIALALFLEGKKYRYSIVPAMRIKETVVTQRGKTDKVDAIRIAEYARRFSDRLVPTKLADSKIFLLRKLMTERRQMVRTRASFVSMESNDHRGVESSILQRRKKLIADLDELIEEIEKQMAEVIASDEQLNRNFHLLDSIKGIGLVNAVNIIVYTENFTLFNNARQYAAFCNIAPYEHSSGTSVRKGVHTSHKGHKQLKADLLMGAKSAIVYNKELKQYYERKLEEGKKKRIIFNNVAFKLITYMFAVVKRESKFVYFNNYSSKKSKIA